MPVSERSSWMSSSRQGAPLIMYSDSPVRNSVRVRVTSVNSIGRSPAELSIVSDTSARPRAGRSAVPAKMTSSILPPRRARAPCAPSTHATESTTLDFPEPFGPTTTQTPGSKSSVVLSAKDLKPFSVSERRNTPTPSPAGDRRGADPAGRGPDGSRSSDHHTLLGSSTAGHPSPHAKARLTDGRDAFGVHGIDPGARRACVTPGHHAFHRGFRSLELGFDRTVRAVAHEAAHAQRARLVLAAIAKPHALHASRDAHADADHRDRI